MKRINVKNIILVLLFIILLGNITAYGDTSYITVTEGPNHRIVDTQVAYEATDMMNPDVSNPEDIFVDNSTGYIYIADTGNSRIVVISDGKIIKTMGENVLQNPTGVFVDKNGKIYAADAMQGEIFIFDNNGKVIKTIGKPKEPLFGINKDFTPQKVAVDQRGNIYVICEGSTNGVVQLNQEGNFLGYIGSNKTNVSLLMIAQRLIFTAAQKGQLLKIEPPSPTNITLDKDGLVYTSTNGINDNPIKKFNIAGINILNDMNIDSSAFVDLDVDKDGFIYALDQSGAIFQYDSFGNLMFLFGGSDSSGERIGLMRNPTGIALTSDGSIYTLDKEKGMIIKYVPTDFAKEVMAGDNLYKEGLYEQSEGIWQNILKMNSSFILSYKALAKAYFKKGDYKDALYSFKLGEDVTGYSDAFWQIRNDWLQNNMPLIIILIVVLIIILRILRALDRKKHIFEGTKAVIKKIKNIRLVYELTFMVRFFKHPIDSYYELKRNKKVSVISASILYAWLLILQILGVYVTGFVFNPTDTARVNWTSVILQTFVPLVLFLAANYLVSAINDGEGTFSDIYKGTIYALSPYLVFSLPIMIISNVLTQNEAFIFSYSMFFLKGWSLLLLFIMVMQVHNYTFKETIRNILITVFAMLMIVLLIFIIVILFTQEFDFVNSVWRELKYRV